MLRHQAERASQSCRGATQSFGSRPCRAAEEPRRAPAASFAAAQSFDSRLQKGCRGASKIDAIELILCNQTVLIELETASAENDKARAENKSAEASIFALSSALMIEASLLKAENTFKSMEPRFVPGPSSTFRGHDSRGGGGGGLQMCREAGLPGSDPESSTPKHRQAPATPPFGSRIKTRDVERSLSQNGMISKLHNMRTS